MNALTKFSIDIVSKGAAPVAYAVQNDSNTRTIELNLTSNGSAWEIPSGMSVAVAFRKSDGTAGLYDVLPDGTKACSYSSNVVRAVLAPQVLTAWGRVEVAVVIQDPSTLDRVATFPLWVEVARDPSAGKGISNDYYRCTSLMDVNEILDGFDQELEEFRGSVRPYAWLISDSSIQSNGWSTFLDLPTNYFYRCSYTLPESFGLPVPGFASTLVIFNASNLDREIYWNRLYICTVRRGAAENQTYIAYTDDGVGLDGVVWRQVMTVSDLEKTGLIAGGNVTASNYATVLPDLDGADINRVYDINNCLQDIANIPDTTATSGTLLYYNGDTSRQNNTNKSFGVQILTATDHKTYLRSCWAGTWTAWRELTDIGVSQKIKALSAAIGDVDGVTIQAVDNNVTVWNYSTVLPDLDTADINRVYAILNCLQDIQHIPDTTATSGTLLYYNGDTTRQDNTNKSFGVQILTATDHKTYLRSCWAGTWTEWGELSGKDDGRVIPNYANFSAFARFGTIGDSLSVGAYRQADGTDTYDEDKSWGEHIARNCHNERLSFGFGGATSTSWIQGVSWTDNGLEKALLPENQCDAYIIALGYNDNNTASSSGGVTLGSMADIDESDPDNNAVSYYGNMDKILRKLHGAFPNAKLFVLNNPYYNTDLAADYNVALSEITARLEGSNVYLIDMYGRYNSIYRELAADREGNHYHPQIYQYMGMLIATAISDYMLDNLAEFKYV